MPNHWWVLSAFLASASVGAHGQTHEQGGDAKPSDVIVGDWRISQAVPGTCQAIARISQHLVFNLVIEKATGRGGFFLESDVWQFTEGNTYSGSVSFDDWATSQALNFQTGSVHDDGLLSARVEPGFPQQLAKADHFEVKIPDIYMGGDIPLKDINGMSAAFATCLQQ
jgi:hypothetical protein